MNYQDSSHPGKGEWVLVAAHWNPDSPSVSCVNLGGVDHVTRELNKKYNDIFKKKIGYEPKEQ